MPVRAPSRIRAVTLAAVALVATLAALLALGAVGPRTAGAQGPPACFGAADRDPLTPCDNPALHFSVTPTPDDALLLPNSPCAITERTSVLLVCSFGTPLDQATGGTIALVGDSHATHWRAALEVVARAHAWSGVSITHASCPLSRARTSFPGVKQSQCVRWNDETTRWLARHPEISTIFVSEHATARVVRARGRTLRETQIQGYLAAWRRLPASVRHVIVIRDTPQVTTRTPGCIDRAVRRHQRPGFACAIRRASALAADPAVAAARRLRSSRVQVVDLTPFFCSPRLCIPVVGGVLTHKDVSHITATYGTTLGPYLDRAVKSLMASWRP